MAGILINLMEVVNMMCESSLYATPVSIISNLHTNLWARLFFL